MKTVIFSLLVLLVPFVSVAQTSSNPANNYVRIATNKGTCVVKLYNETPLHRDNFLKLVRDTFYNGTLFHRVIKEFMIQGGDPNSKNASPGMPLGMGNVGYRIPAEFNPMLIHKKGALAAARDNNPEKASSGCQFYIVQGKPLTDMELNQIENYIGMKYTPDQRTIYKTLGGVAFLDNNYTVFGEVVKGLAMVDSVANAPKGADDRPQGDVKTQMQVLTPTEVTLLEKELYPKMLPEKRKAKR